MDFPEAPIAGVLWRPLTFQHDARGWLCELFRHDEVSEAFHPAMAYISATHPGMTRGPHEHLDQADFFCFLGPSDFKLFLWDNRPASPSYRCRQTAIVGESKPTAVIIPAGVVHAYRNVGQAVGIVINCPNRLYRGPGKQGPADELRYEERADSPYALD